MGNKFSKNKTKRIYRKYPSTRKQNVPIYRNLYRKDILTYIIYIIFFKKEILT